MSFGVVGRWTGGRL